MRRRYRAGRSSTRPRVWCQHQSRSTSRRRQHPQERLTLSRRFLLRINEGPDFIALETFARRVPQRFVLIGRARYADIAEQLDHSVLCRAGHADGSADVIALYEAGKDSRAIFDGKLVHFVGQALGSSSIYKIDCLNTTDFLIISQSLLS